MISNKLADYFIDRSTIKNAANEKLNSDLMHYDS